MGCCVPYLRGGRGRRSRGGGAAPAPPRRDRRSTRRRRRDVAGAAIRDAGGARVDARHVHVVDEDDELGPDGRPVDVARALVDVGFDVDVWTG